MFDSIDPRSPTPLYEQIGACIRVAVAAGELSDGEALPSVRQLSGALRVNPATVSQAYRELAREGFVEMRHGAGTFVRAIPPARREEEQLLQARKLVRRALADAARLGIGASRLLKVLEWEVAEATGDGASRVDPDPQLLRRKDDGRGDDDGSGGGGARTAVSDDNETLTKVGE